MLYFYRNLTLLSRGSKDPAAILAFINFSLARAASKCFLSPNLLISYNSSIILDLSTPLFPNATAL
jgi:hypothetical protein